MNVQGTGQPPKWTKRKGACAHPQVVATNYKKRIKGTEWPLLMDERKRKRLSLDSRLWLNLLVCERSERWLGPVHRKEERKKSLFGSKSIAIALLTRWSRVSVSLFLRNHGDQAYKFLILCSGGAWSWFLKIRDWAQHAYFFMRLSGHYVLSLIYMCVCPDSNLIKKW